MHSISHHPLIMIIYYIFIIICTLEQIPFQFIYISCYLNGLQIMHVWWFLMLFFCIFFFFFYLMHFTKKKNNNNLQNTCNNQLPSRTLTIFFERTHFITHTHTHTHAWFARLLYVSSPFNPRPSFTSFGLPFRRMHQDVFRLTDSDSSEEDSSWPFGLSSINSREKIESSAEDGEVLRTTLGRDTEPLGEIQVTYLRR